MDGRRCAAGRRNEQALRKTISYHDYRGRFFITHFWLGFLQEQDMVESNKEHGEGRTMWLFLIR